MSSKLFAILTVLVIGIVSFLIGKFLTSSKWKKKYLEANSQNKLLEKRKIVAEAALKDAKVKEEEARKKIKELLSTKRSNDQKIKDLEKRIRNKPKIVGHTEESYNEIVNALNAENKKVISLETQLIKKATVSASQKRTSASTFKSFDNDQIGTHKVISTKTKYTGSLATILERMSVFNNLAEQDDLTKVDGITTIISDKLKKEGIHNYKQIAMLENNDFPIVAKAIGMKPDEINKYNWIGIARDLYHKKYKVEL